MKFHGKQPPGENSFCMEGKKETMSRSDAMLDTQTSEKIAYASHDSSTALKTKAINLQPCILSFEPNDHLANLGKCYGCQMLDKNF